MSLWPCKHSALVGSIPAVPTSLIVFGFLSRVKREVVMKYRIYIDEVGNANVENATIKRDSAEVTLNARYLSLTGIVAPIDFVRTALHKVSDLHKPEASCTKRSLVDCGMRRVCQGGRKSISPIEPLACCQRCYPVRQSLFPSPVSLPTCQPRFP